MLDAYNQWKAEPTPCNYKSLTEASAQDAQLDPKSNLEIFA